MNILNEYWETGSGELRSAFERSRNAHTDSAVKGAANERQLAAFLAQNTGAERIALNSSVFDADGRRSDEVDVVLVNSYQPLWSGEPGRTASGQLLIAEGVDAVFQVKAVLTHEELRRSVKNARSVKSLLRPLGDGSLAKATDIDGTRFIDHIPFFVFAYEARMTAEAAATTLTEQLADDPWHQQPDGVFVLDDWTLVNVADNTGALKIGPIEQHGFRLTNRSPLAMMLWCNALFTPRILHLAHPIARYHPFTPL